MYHISRKLDWQIGDVLICGEKNNPFWETCTSFEPRISFQGQKITLFELFDKCPEIQTTEENVKSLYNNLKTISKECAFYIREQVFEDIRTKYYPDKPSRQKCLWVTDEEQLSYWKTISPNTPRCILTLELDGIIFCGDDYWLTVNTFSSIVYAERAHHYWSGETSSHSHKEYLFYGLATIKELEFID